MAAEVERFPKEAHVDDEGLCPKEGWCGKMSWWQGMRI